MKIISGLAVLGLAAIFVLGILVSGCPRRDEAEERAICGDLADKLCDKWFDCWPILAAEWWGNEADCSAAVKATCANGDELLECDMDNDDLEDCNDNVDGSECGDLPQSCIDLIECSG